MNTLAYLFAVLQNCVYINPLAPAVDTVALALSDIITKVAPVQPRVLIAPCPVSPTAGQIQAQSFAIVAMHWQGIRCTTEYIESKGACWVVAEVIASPIPQPSAVASTWQVAA